MPATTPPEDKKDVKNEMKTPASDAAKAPVQKKPEKEKKDGSNRLLLILLILLALGSGGLGWLLMDQTKKTEVAVERGDRLEEEKAKVEAELKKKIEEIAALIAEKGDLTGDLEKIKADLEAALADVKKYKATASRVYSAQASAKQATDRYNMLRAQYDSLLLTHNKLSDDFTQSQTELKASTAKNEELTQQNTQLTETVETGQVLVAYNVNANGIQVKKSGKEKIRNKASKANKIETCFMLGKNAIAETGSKQVYMRVESPDGVVLAQGTESNQFEAEGKQMMYTTAKEINYTGRAEDICMSFMQPDGSEFKAGQFTVQIYADGKKIGESTLMLE